MQIQLHGSGPFFWQGGVRDDKRAELKNGAAWTEWMVCWCVLTAEVCGAICCSSISSVSNWACRNASSRLLIETSGVREVADRSCCSSPRYSGRSGGKSEGGRGEPLTAIFSHHPCRAAADPIKTLKNLFLSGSPCQLMIPTAGPPGLL